MEIINLPIGSIKPYAKNAKLHDKQQIDNVAVSIKQYGFVQPLVVDRDGVIIIGHCRYEAAKKLRLKEVPCVRADTLTEDEVKALRLADNRLNESPWDFEILADELDGLDFGELELDWGIEGEDKPQEVTEDDYEPEPPAEPRAKLGDIYQLGSHRLMCGDSTSAEDVARLMGGAKADMVFTDPPYNVAVGDKNKVLNEHNHEKRGKRIEQNIEGDAGMTDEEIGENLWRPAFQNMRDNAKDCCSIYVTMPQGGSHMMMMMMMSASWQVKHELIWVKNQPTFSMGRLNYDYQHEPICYGWAKTHTWYGKGEYTKSIWTIDKPRESKLHPTMKPIELIANAIMNSSKEDDIVVDLFGGSGSTLIACEQTGRTCYMMELDSRYIDTIIQRYIKFVGSDDGVFLIKNGEKIPYSSI